MTTTTDKNPYPHGKRSTKEIAKTSNGAWITCGVCGSPLTSEEMCDCPYSSSFGFVHEECFGQQPKR